jgi:hypothetical protein
VDCRPGSSPVLAPRRPRGRRGRLSHGARGAL